MPETNGESGVTNLDIGDIVDREIKETIFIVDWDGVVCEAVWPEWGDWIEGAIDGLKALLTLGKVRIYSSRINPYKFGFDGVVLGDPKETERAIKKMRKLLDDVGLTAVEIHTTHGKPTGHYYIDDRAVEFSTKLGGWKGVLQKIQGQEIDFGPESRATDPVTGGKKGRKQAVFANIPIYAQVMKARVHGFGIFKYPDEGGAPNWTKGTPWSWMYDAAQRHLLAFWSGETINPESGLPHLAHAAWMLDILMEFEFKGLGTDDRPRW